MLLEYLSGFRARCPVGQHRNRFLAAGLDSPIGDDFGLLAEREARAHVIGERSVTTDVPEIMTTVGVSLSVAIGAIDIAVGVVPAPSMAT